MNFLKSNWKEAIIILITFLFVIVSFNNHFHDEAIITIEEADSKIAESSKFVFALKKGISFFSSSKIPLIKGYANVSLTDLNKVSNYLNTAQVLLKIQSYILKFSNLIFFKILPLLICIGIFFKPIQLLALKLTIVSLCICPGLSIYTNGIHKISEEINEISLGGNLHKSLKETKESFEAKEEALKKHQELVKQRQLKRAESRGKDHISFFKKAEDAVVNTIQSTAIKIEKDTKLIEDVLVINTEKLFSNIIRLISSIILLIVVLPLLYFYGMNILVKDLFQFNLKPYLEQLIKKEELK